MATKRRGKKAAAPSTSKSKAASKRKAKTSGRKAAAKPKARAAKPAGAAKAKPAARIKVCHDRLLPQAMVRPHHVMRGPGGMRAVLFFRKLWVNGSTLRVRFLGGTAAQRAKARTQALWWSQHANLKFAFNDALDAEIRIAFDPNDGAWSYIGTDCRSIPQGEPTMNLGFLDGGTAGHEFGHAIGFGHEHQNPQGGIKWNEARVIQDLSGPPNNWTPAQIRHNVLEKYAVDQIRGTTFDSKSIMLYFFPGNWVQSGIGTEQNEVLSATDKQFIASSQGYPPTVSPTIPLQINAAPKSASIGVPGEEDIFTFNVTQAGRHVIETGGQTDVVMKLFGPGSQTNLLAEDDDSGFGLNSKISADLMLGSYFVQVRHYNRSNGTGNYTVRVQR
jgi:astacin (peptidase family M12A)